LKTVRASEIGTYLYCHRALWYHLQGMPSENAGELLSGSELHEQHGRLVIVTGCLRTLAYLLILAALILLTISLMGKIL
jgi:CRISPR/Cas system-associated exonuclease Cas4 (RecB family)